MTQAYELMAIRLGDHELMARPIGWDGEDDNGFGVSKSGDDVLPVKWMLTCPYCANLVEPEKDDLYVATDNTEYNVKCTNCDKGKTYKRKQFIKSVAESMDNKAIFIDPIKEGLFNEKYDKDLLVDIDKKLVASF